MTAFSQQNLEQAFLEALYGNKTKLKDLTLVPDFENRFDIYETSILATHQQALYKTYKPLEVLLGIDAFQELCYRYVKMNLSKHFNFNFYGADFHQFAVNAPYANNFPYLSDFIQFCYLWQQVFLDPTQGIIKIESDYPVYAIWERCQPEFTGDTPISDWHGPFSYTIYRENGKVIVL